VIRLESQERRRRRVNHRGAVAASQAQRGSAAVTLLLMMLSLVTMLGVVEVGYLYWAKRDTQKVADLAALAGAQQLNACTAGNQGNSAALGNAQVENGFAQSATQTLTITCGTWDPVANSGIADHFSASGSGSAPNAVKVVAQRPVLPIWGMAGALPKVSAEAVASGLQPTAVFSVGSTLAVVSGKSALGQLLTSVGVSIPEASLVGYAGIANATVTPSGLLKQLGVEVPANITVGGLNQLLTSTVGVRALADVLNAAVTAAGQQQLVSANATLVNAVTTAINASPGTVTLGSPGTAGGLFAQVVTPNGTGDSAQAALNARVNLLQLISTAVGVATKNHAIAIPNATINLNPITITAAASVIEPPAIGIGGVGTTAYTAQIRAFVNINIATANTPLIGKLISPLLIINLDLPIAIDLVNSQATLTSLCTSKDSSGRDLAAIQVHSSVLKTCVGAITQANAFSTAGSCDQISGANTNKQLVNITLAGNPLANVNTHFVIGALPASGSDTFYAGKTENLPAGGTPLAIGSTVTNLFSALNAAVLGTTIGPNNAGIAPNLASDLWNANSNAHTGLFPNNNQLSAAMNQLYGSTSSLNSFLQNTPQQVTDILGSTLSLNLAGIVNGVGGLVQGLGNLLGGILGNLGCTGSVAVCQNVISGSLSGNASSGVPNGLLGLLGFVFQTLQAPLNQVGTSVISPLLNDTLGLQLGVSTVNLQSLQCHPVQLVY